MNNSNRLFIYSNGRAAAIDEFDGHIIWESKIKQYASGVMNYAIGQITVSDNKVFISVSGILVCLNAYDGSFIWKNDLKGWGYQFVSIAGATSEAAAASAKRTAAAASS